MSINQIEQALLAPNGLTEQDIADTLASIATRQIDYADIYFQSSWHESLVLEDSIIKDGSSILTVVSVYVQSQARKPVSPTQTKFN